MNHHIFGNERFGCPWICTRAETHRRNFSGGDKSYLGEKSIRTYHDEPTHAKIFIEFIALIIRNKIYTCLKDRMRELQKKKNYMTVTAALKELDKIEIIRQMDGVYRLDHAVTATQKDILQAFNMTEATIKKEA